SGKVAKAPPCFFMLCKGDPVSKYVEIKRSQAAADTKLLKGIFAQHKEPIKSQQRFADLDLIARERARSRSFPERWLIRGNPTIILTNAVWKISCEDACSFATQVEARVLGAFERLVQAVQEVRVPAGRTQFCFQEIAARRFLPGDAYSSRAERLF